MSNHTRIHAPAPHTRSGAWQSSRLIATLAATTVIAGLGIAPAAASAPAGSSTSAAGPSPASQIGTASGNELRGGRYIVLLDDDPAATYGGGVDSFAPTKPDSGTQLESDEQAVGAYSDYLGRTQASVAASAGVEIDQSYRLALNGFSASFTADQLAHVVRQKNVLGVVEDRLLQLTADSTETGTASAAPAAPSGDPSAFSASSVSAAPSVSGAPSVSAVSGTGAATSGVSDPLGLRVAGGLWSRAGGPDSAGKGMVVGVIDSGIAPENPSFAGAELGTEPGTLPYSPAVGETRFEKADGGTFSGVCQTGVQFEIDDCSTKIIGARYFSDGYGDVGTPIIGEYESPRDGSGHGSHTAATAAGASDVEATVGGSAAGRVSGVAPAAKIAVYKVCWKADPEWLQPDGCAESDVIAGIEAAVADGVDVINYSIGGGGAASTVTPVDAAFLGAGAAGIFVAASAGNDGPDASTVDKAAPWVTTAAASTIPTIEATVELGVPGRGPGGDVGGERLVGASASIDASEGATAVTGRLVTAASVTVVDPEDPASCAYGSLDPRRTEGTIVLCELGASDPAELSGSVLASGGVGMVLVDPAPSVPFLHEDRVPTVHLDGSAHTRITTYASTAGATATLRPGNSTGAVTPYPVVAPFSSKGPADVDGGDVLKPDLAAPGVSILASGENAEGGSPTWHYLTGTSMAGPHVAGLAAIYLGVHPLASPSEIKSALMTTADDTVDSAGDTVVDPFVQGAGEVAASKILDPGLVYLSTAAEWRAYAVAVGHRVPGTTGDPIDPSDLNLASISVGLIAGTATVTRTVTSTRAGSFTADTSGLPGVDTTVTPATLDFSAAGETRSFTVTFARTDAPVGAFITGQLIWSGGGTTVRSPVAVRPAALDAPSAASGVGVTGSASWVVTPGGDDEIPITSNGLAARTLVPDPTDPTSGHSGSGVPFSLFSFTIDVPESVEYLRIDLDALDNSADLDLSVCPIGADGEVSECFGAKSDYADERLNLENPTAGQYYLQVEFFASDVATVFDLSTTTVRPGGVPFTIRPASVPATPGTAQTIVADWTFLAPFTTYLTMVHYGETGRSTLVEVITQENTAPDPPKNLTAPTVEGTPLAGRRLTATTGEWSIDGLSFAYQWQVAGKNVAGATDASFTVRRTDVGKDVRVIVIATKDGLPSAKASSTPVTVRYLTEVVVTPGHRAFFSWQRTQASIDVTSAGDPTPTGVVVVTVDGVVRTRLTVRADAAGHLTFRLPQLTPGLHTVRASFVPDGTGVQGSTSRRSVVWVLF